MALRLFLEHRKGCSEARLLSGPLCLSGGLFTPTRVKRIVFSSELLKQFDPYQNVTCVSLLSVGIPCDGMNSVTLKFIRGCPNPQYIRM